MVAETKVPPRPIAPKVQFKNVPILLKTDPRWVAWRYELRDSPKGPRWTKPPINVRTGKHAESNDPETWATYGDAFGYYLERDDVNGIGYMVTRGAGTVFLDMDRAIDEWGEIKPWAQPIVDRFSGTYIETSPSGTGLKILALGTIPANKMPKVGDGQVEAFASGKYTTITGNRRSEANAQITEQQDALDWFFAEYVVDRPQETARRSTSSGSSLSDDLELIRKAFSNPRNGAAIFALWNGDTKAYDDDHSRADAALCAHIAYYVDGDPARIEAVFNCSQLNRDKWRDRKDYRERTIATATAGMTKFYEPYAEVTISLPKVNGNGHHADGTHDHDADDQNGGDPPDDAGDRNHVDAGEFKFNQTDTGNAERFTVMHGHDVRYSKLEKRWYVWDGARFAHDENGLITNRATQTVYALYDGLKDITDKDAREKAFKFALKSESAASIGNMLSLAESKGSIPINVNAFDRDPYLYNVQNGTIDLRTGKLLPHDRCQLITKLAPVAYDPDATCPRFLAFLRRAMDNDDSLVTFLQRAIGYSMTGSIVERVIFIMWGGGKNGKTTFLEVVREILGDYSARTPTETIMAKRDPGVPHDVAALRGSRFVTTSETDDGQRLAEAKIKDLTGGDLLTARHLYSALFSFVPTFKLWLATNRKPVIKGTDDAIWDRVRLVPFTVRIPKAEQDPHLREKLIAEAPGILAWAVQGCLDWQRHGLTEPAKVTEATEDYRSEMDVLGRFIDECCTVGQGLSVPSGPFYGAYRNWCTSGGEDPMSENAFGRELLARGFDVKRVGASRTRFRLGIALNPNDEDERHA